MCKLNLALDLRRPDRLFAAQMASSVDVCFVFMHVNAGIGLFEYIMFIFPICTFIFRKWKKRNQGINNNAITTLTVPRV